MVNLLSSFPEDLRKHLISIYELRGGKEYQGNENKFQWTEECQKPSIISNSY